MRLSYEVCTEYESFLVDNLEEAAASMWESINKFGTRAWVNVYDGPFGDDLEEAFDLVDMIPFATVDENLSVEFIPESYLYSTETSRDVIHIVKGGIILEAQECVAGEWITTETDDEPIPFDEFYCDYATTLMEDIEDLDY
jgi:hypothetical protein